MGEVCRGSFRKIPPCTVGSLTFLSFFFSKDEGRPPGQLPPERARQEQARRKPQNLCNLILDIPSLLCFLHVRSRSFGPAHAWAKTIPQGHRGEDHGAIVGAAYQFTAYGNEYASGECDFGSVGAIIIWWVKNTLFLLLVTFMKLLIRWFIKIHCRAQFGEV